MIYGKAQNRPAIEPDEDGRYLVHFPAPSSSTQSIQPPLLPVLGVPDLQKCHFFSQV
jgi:hypothetical protein